MLPAKTVIPEERAKRLLQHQAAPALLVYACAAELLGPDVEEFDPETSRLILKEMHQLDVPDVNFDKLEAMCSIYTAPGQVLSSGPIFEAVAVAVSGEPVLPGRLQEAEAEHLAWGVEVVRTAIHRRYRSSTELDGQYLFDREVRCLIAARLFEDGFALAPTNLEMVQPLLDLETGQPAFAQRVREQWSETPKLNLTALELTEDAIDVQIARLASVDLFLAKQRHEYQTVLQGLVGGAS